MRRIILASASPRRKALLEELGLKFEVIVSSFDEESIKIKNPKKLVETLSKKKAQEVANKIPDAIVIGADTVITLDNTILGKPRDKKDAQRMLSILSGKVHSVITGFTIIDSLHKISITKSLGTKVYFKKLNLKQIKEYIDTGEPMDKAGAYAIQEEGGKFVAKIEGDYSNIVGLPLDLLKQEFWKLKIEL